MSAWLNNLLLTLRRPVHYSLRPFATCFANVGFLCFSGRRHDIVAVFRTISKTLSGGVTDGYVRCEGQLMIGNLLGLIPECK